MPKSLEFHTFDEKRPEHEQEIFYFHVSDFYNSVGPHFATIHYSWVEYDEDGEATGTSYCYSKDDTPPNNCRIEIGCDNGKQINPKHMWCPFDSIDDMVNE